jgi:hypothetical protein
MPQNLVVTGKFLGAKATQLLGENQFAVRSFYIDLTENEQYPSTPEFQLTGDKVNLVDNLQKGQQVQVKFNIEGRKYTNREGKDAVATNLRAWKIDLVTTQSAATAQAPAPRQAPAPAPPAMTGPGAYATQQRAETAASVTPGHPDNDLPF